MTSIDSTWAIRVEAPGLEPVVTGPLTRSQADGLVGIYLDRDRDEAMEDGPTRRRITVEEYDPSDPDLEPVIPEGAERFSWLATAFLAAFCIGALYFAFHTYHLTFSASRAKDEQIAVVLAFLGAGGLLLILGDVASRAMSRLVHRWVRSSRRRAAEVTS